MFHAFVCSVPPGGLCSCFFILDLDQFTFELTAKKGCGTTTVEILNEKCLFIRGLRVPGARGLHELVHIYLIIICSPDIDP